MNKKYKKVEIKNTPKSTIEVSVTVPAEVVSEYFTKQLKKLQESTELKGFRKGKAPENVILREYGENFILNKAGEDIINDVYPTIVLEKKLKVIDRPIIKITTLEKNKDFKFVATATVIPEFDLPDYKKLAQSIKLEKPETVTDKELQETLLHIRKQKARIDSFEKQKADGVEHPKVPTDIKDEDAPKLTDEFVQTLGEFKTVKDFEKKVREDLLNEKQSQTREKRRIQIADKILEKTSMEVPDVLIEAELDRLWAQFESDIQNAGVSVDNYLKQAKQTQEELRTKWRPDAEKRAKLQLILNKIAKENSLLPDSEKVEHELSHLMQAYPDADRESARIYIETMLLNEQVFEMLEKF